MKCSAGGHGCWCYVLVIFSFVWVSTGDTGNNQGRIQDETTSCFCSSSASPGKKQSWRLSATPEEISQQIVSSDTSSTEAIVSGGGSQDGVALIIQVLLIVAFLALSVLTIGVVYIGVTEFLGKREREKFEKEEAAKKSKKSGKKKPTRAKAGPRGSKYLNSTTWLAISESFESSCLVTFELFKQ
ncbi:Uncharacterized protein Rs2_46773 [Raphanus sativus]|nr:Uncharacterized protein Rs2_46773 [Raphanus sativus]